MDVNIASNKSDGFANSFLAGYGRLGFGNLPKKEIDLLVFRLLLDSGALGEDTDMQQISRKLSLPIAKVKSLYYEMQLRDEKLDGEWVKKQVRKLLQRSQLVTSGESGTPRIEVGMESPLLRKEVEAMLKRDGHFPDYSFNRDILRLTPEAYGVLIETVMTDHERIQFQQDLHHAVAAKKVTPLPDTNLLQLAAREFVVSSAREAGKKIVNFSVDAFKDGLPILLANVINLVATSA